MNTEGDATSYDFSYGVNGNCTEKTVSAPIELPESSTAQSVSTTISNLVGGELYCVEISATNPLLYTILIAYFAQAEASPMITPFPVALNLTNLMPSTTYCLSLTAFNFSGATAELPTPVQFSTLAAQATTSTPVTAPTATPVSLPIAAKLVSPVNTAAPSVRGRAISGEKLLAVSGRWSGTAPLRYTYQWQRCDRAGRHCVMIEGATSSVLKVAARDAHDRLGVIVTAHNSAGSTRKLSALTAAVEAKA